MCLCTQPFVVCVQRNTRSPLEPLRYGPESCLVTSTAKIHRASVTCRQSDLRLSERVYVLVAWQLVGLVLVLSILLHGTRQVLQFATKGLGLVVEGWVVMLARWEGCHLNFQALASPPIHLASCYHHHTPSNPCTTPYPTAVPLNSMHETQCIASLRKYQLSAGGDFVMWSWHSWHNVFATKGWMNARSSATNTHSFPWPFPWPFLWRQWSFGTSLCVLGPNTCTIFYGTTKPPHAPTLQGNRMADIKIRWVNNSESMVDQSYCRLLAYFERDICV